MLICSMILLLTVCSFFGWIYESIYAVVTTGKWESRGFLYGPVCPIYGIGVVAIVLITKQIVTFAGFNYEWVHVALVAFFGSMVLEYLTSWVLEKLFHAYWWNYSNMPLNINGRTCVPAACLFSLGGLAAVYLIAPAWDALVAPVPFTVIEIAAMIVISLFSIDATLTVSSLTNFQKQVASVDAAFNNRAAEITDKMTSFGLDTRERIHVSRERFIERGLIDLTENMGGITRATLSRVRGFLPTTDEEKSRLSRVLKMVKGKRGEQVAECEHAPADQN